MRKDEITFICKKEGVTKIKEVEREEFYKLMKSIKNSFSDDNEISTKLVELIPDLTSITVDVERNSHLSIPCIYCVHNGETERIEVRRRHTVLWSIFDKYCE